MKHDDKCEWQNGLMTHACGCAARARAGGAKAGAANHGPTKVVAAVPTGSAGTLASRIKTLASLGLPDERITGALDDMTAGALIAAEIDRIHAKRRMEDAVVGMMDPTARGLADS